MDCIVSVKGKTKLIVILLEEVYYDLEKIIGMRIVTIHLTKYINKKPRVYNNISNNNSSNYQRLLLHKNLLNKL